MRYWICVCQEYDEDWQEEYGAQWEWWKYGEDGETGGKYPACFELMREGDKVLCYQSSAHSFTAELEVKEKFETNSKMKLTFKCEINIPLERITDEKHYPQILKHNAKQYAPFNESKRNLLFGTFFATTKEQFDAICALHNCNF